MTFVLGLATVLLGALLVAQWQRQAVLRREAFIRCFVLPRGLFEKLRQRRPELSLKEFVETPVSRWL